ncbi:MAG: hypothetical protein LBQ05_01855 [Christensenellaceae bacterium]|jgi:hypothetical protein|nr:hypothetical protein [Christensenellaceae bacterium]
MGITEILQQINDAEKEADNIILRAKTQIADLEKDTAIQIDKLNAEVDAEIAEKSKAFTPTATVKQGITLTVAPDKINSAVAYATKEFYTRYGV